MINTFILKRSDLINFITRSFSFKQTEPHQTQPLNAGLYVLSCTLCSEYTATRAEHGDSCGTGPNNIKWIVWATQNYQHELFAIFLFNLNNLPQRDMKKEYTTVTLLSKT